MSKIIRKLRGVLHPFFGRDMLLKNLHLHPCLYQIPEDSYSYLYQNFENVYPNVQKTWKWISEPTMFLNLHWKHVFKIGHP